MALLTGSALLSFAVCVLPFVAAAQTPATLSGRVVASEARTPVAGAVIDAGTSRAVSDAEGRFSVAVSSDRVRVDVSAKGFSNQRVEVTMSAGMPPLEILLVVSPEFKESVTVSAVSLDEAPASATMALKPTAVQQVAGAADNIFKALQTLPGVNATDDFSSRLSVRGGGPDQNLTVMDGVEIHNPYRLFGLTSAFNPEIVDHFELTAGGFGAKYGDRLSSILLVDNRQGATSRTLAGSATASLTDANVVLEGKLPGHATGSWLVTGRRTYYDLVARRFTKSQLPSFEDIQAKGVWTPKPGHTLTMFALRSHERTDATFTDDSDHITLGDRSRNDVAALSYSAVLGTRASSRTIAAWYQYDDALDVDGEGENDSQRSNSPTPDATGRAVIVFTRDLAVRDVSLRQELGMQAGTRHFLEAGFDMHLLRTVWGWTIGDETTRDQANGSSARGGSGLPSLLDSTRDTTRAGAWFQDRYQPNTRLRIEPGVRLDHSGVAGETVVSPRLGVRVDLTKTTRLRGAVGRYTQSPGYEKLLQSDYFVDLTAADAHHLTSEQSIHAIGAIERSLTPTVTARVEVYHKTFDRLIVGRLETPDETAARVQQYSFPPSLASSVPTAPRITSLPSNGASGRAYGFDAYIEKAPQTRRDRLSGWASYTWGVADVDAYGRRYPFDYDRRHSASVVGTVRIRPRLDFSATLRAASGFPGTPAVGTIVASTLAPGATSGAAGSLVPAVDPHGLYMWQVDHGGVPNLNSTRLPFYARLDLRVTFNPKQMTGRWQIYFELLNALNRKNVSALQSTLVYDPSGDRPRLVSGSDDGFPRLPSFGVRYRF